jgi:hypothetical protein
MPRLVSLDKLIEIRRTKYDVTKNIYCPLLKEAVYFNNKGFRHVTHDGRGHIRTESDARMRLNLLPCINTVISRSTRFGSPPRVKPKSHPKNSTGKEVVEYELCCKFNQHKEVSVILRRIGNGRLHYYSVRYTKKQNRSPRGSA